MPTESEAKYSTFADKKGNELQNEKLFLDNITNTADVFIVYLDINANIILFNKFAEDLTGYKKEEVTGLNWFDIFIPKKDLDEMSIVFKDLLNGHTKYSAYKNTILLKDRSERLLIWKNSLNYNESNEVSGMLSIGIDITYQDKIEGQLEISEKKQKRLFSTAVEQSPCVFVITDIIGNIEYVNPSFTKLTGYTLEEAMGKNPRILKSGKQPDVIYKELWETISSGGVWKGEILNKNKNGDLFLEATTISPIKDKDGKIIHYLKISKDITKEKETEELSKKNKDLEEYNNLFIGREFRIKELRDKIKKYEDQFGLLKED
jgi:PAS domain S-box-containing protein